MDWFSAALGWLFLRAIVGGSVLVSMAYLWWGNYMFAAAILLPLVAVLAWMAADMRDDWPPQRPGDGE